MCTGAGRDSPAPSEAIRLRTHDPGRADARRPPTQSGPPPSRSGERPPPSRRAGRPSSSSQGDRRRPPSSSHERRRPSTATSTTHRDERPSSRARPSSSREHASNRQPGPQRRTGIDTIPEHRPVQYTEDQTIISRVAELHTLTDQHSDNFYIRDDVVGNGISDSELNDPRTRHATIRRRIARTIIDNIILLRRDRYNIEIHTICLIQSDRVKSSDVDVRNTATELSANFARYAFTDSNRQRENHLYELCKLGAELRSLISSNPSTWTFGAWDEVIGAQSGYIVVFPVLLQDDVQVAPRRIFRI
jgi:hypothetical protein